VKTTKSFYNQNELNSTLKANKCTSLEKYK